MFAPWISHHPAEVDPKRIGCVGLSSVGSVPVTSPALDDRIKAAVVVGWMASFPAQLKSRLRNTIGPHQAGPGLYRYLDYRCGRRWRCRPGPFSSSTGKKDQLFDLDGVQQSFDKIESCYKKAGSGIGSALAFTTRLMIQTRDASGRPGVGCEKWV